MCTLLDCDRDRTLLDDHFELRRPYDSEGAVIERARAPSSGTSNEHEFRAIRVENANKVHRPPTNAMSDQKCPKKALGRGIRTSLSEYFLERGIIISLFVSAARDAPTMQLVPGLRIARAKVKWVNICMAERCNHVGQ